MQERGDLIAQCETQIHIDNFGVQQQKGSQEEGIEVE